MDRATRKDLLETIEKQKEQVARYEKRLRDVIHAYKSLVKEKEALEASLQILSQPPPQQPSAEPLKDKEDDKHSEDGEKDDASEQGEKFEDPLSVNAQPQDSNGNSEDVTITQLKGQLATLTNALATVTAEKTKMEQSFQADKKKIRQEQEDLSKFHAEEKKTYEEQLTRIQEQFSEAKSKLRAQQLDLEQEHTSHAMILHELQQLVAAERAEKEKLEQKVDDLQDALQKQKSVPNKTEEYERRITLMSEELEAVRRRLKASEDQASKPSPLLLELQREMAEMKAQHRIQVQLEQQKAVEAEEKLRQVAESDEHRVSSLEAKLSDLSEVVGNYERLRYQDQLAIQRLKERVTQLDLENTALARVANKTPVPYVADDGEDSNLNVNTLVEKITKMKGLLKLANQRAEKPVDIDDVCNIEDCTSLESDPAHRACQQELKQLKDEFERYKVRAQNVLKSKNAKDNTSSKEMESLKNQVTDLRERVSTLRQQLDDQDKQHQEKIADMLAEKRSLQDQHKEDLVIAEAEYKHKVGELEEQVHKQRDRTLALIEEKDREIELVKQKIQQTYGAYGGDFQFGSRHSSVDMQSESGEGSKQFENEATISELLSHSQTHLSGMPGGDTAILHYVDLQARKDVEIASLRKQKHQLETALRQLQDKCVMTDEKYNEEIEKLQEEVRRLERSQSRESANLEYLKNVIYNYMMSDDYPGKQRMLNAIMTILHFSPRERDKVNVKKNATWSAYFNASPSK
ncbi:GRIP and coiled-coil domain-containing protein 1-like isoform X2 [Ptychodera flava]|uniref:GRIP and coiled-coil domain-containing protein 1-like isoform X2 n=1 Tax=Ptychodera flava TaxID=63121 RepID=UPI00396A3990